MRLLIGLLFFAAGMVSHAQTTVKVLFIGNSYTYVNDLPQLTANLAASLSDSLIFDSNTIGGYTFQNHTNNATTLAKIQAQAWDYVVLQEQSQRPSFPPAQVESDVYPYADSLNRKIKENDSCTTTLLYMTWGRQNGDASNCANYAPLCTYTGMQQRLHDSYLEMAQNLDAEVSPVGVAWRTMRDSFPALNLYDPDESHPSIYGSYLAACTFYASMFHKSPVGGTYPVAISATDAANIQHIAAQIVFDSLATWNIDTLLPQALFTTTQPDKGEVTFTNNSLGASSYFWYFGDGTTSTDVSPQHTYVDSGTYQVQLIASESCKGADTLLLSVIIPGAPVDTTTPTGMALLSDDDLAIYPNPANNSIIIKASYFKDAVISVYDLTGKQVLLLQWHTGESINIEQLSAGVDVLNVQSEGVMMRKELVVLD